MASLPKNAHVSSHPCLRAKLSQLRSASTSSKDVQALVHDIALMVGYEALASGLKAEESGTVCSSFQIVMSVVSFLEAEHAPRRSHIYTPLYTDHVLRTTL